MLVFLKGEESMNRDLSFILSFAPVAILFILFGYGYSYKNVFFAGAIGAAIYLLIMFFLFLGKKYTFFSLICVYNSIGVFIFNCFLLFGFVIYFSCWDIVGWQFHVFAFYPVLFIFLPDRWCIGAKGARLSVRHTFAFYYFLFGIGIFSLIHFFVAVVPCMQVVIALIAVVLLRHVFTRMAE
jgi:hypothetical protein